MKYGRLILNENRIDLIDKIKANESLAKTYPLEIKSIKVKVLTSDEDYSVSNLKADLIVDNRNSDGTTKFEITYNTPLECLECV